MVINYLHNTDKRFNIFVGRRVAAIYENTSLDSWYFCPGRMNVADYCSRGVKIKNRHKALAYMDGPYFLFSENFQPKHLSLSYEIPLDEAILAEYANPVRVFEVKAHQSSYHTTTLNIISKYSSLYKLKRITCWILRFYKVMKHRQIKSNKEVKFEATDTITLDELNEAENHIIIFVQRICFPREMMELPDFSSIDESLRNQHVYIKRGNLVRLHPVKVNNILRVGGRLRHAPLPFEQKHPIILPNLHPFTSLVINHYHESLGHSGPRHILSRIREKYWIIHGLKSVRHVLKECRKCRFWKAPLGEQLMGSLPPGRITQYRAPFYTMGTDLMGPILVKNKRSHKKRYVVIFTCLATRLCHFEIAHSLNTDSFINYLVTFV